MNKKYGFTFAEVMITLVIVGVVSMLVVPNLLDSSNQKVNIAAAKKAKYEIAQASLMTQSDDGCMNWRNCNPHDRIREHLRSTREIQYRVGPCNNNCTELNVIADIDGDNSPDIEYRVVNNGTIKNKNDNDLVCTVENYEDEVNPECTAWNAQGYEDSRR